jgi:[ribosomal protein S5]-alanine N-acetyltransferase
MTISVAFAAFPALYTKRLHLRRVGLSDTDALFDLYGTDDVAQYLDIDTLVDRAGAAALAEFFVRSYDEQFALRWGITLQGDDRLIGTCVFNGLDTDNRRAEIGYDLLPAYWRQGIATEALHAILRYAFVEMELNRVEAVISPDNVASRALLKKLGFVQEGYLRQRIFQRGSFHDDVFYGLLCTEYMQTR